jgi:hypothetical protein
VGHDADVSEKPDVLLPSGPKPWDESKCAAYLNVLLARRSLFGREKVIIWSEMWTANYYITARPHIPEDNSNEEWCLLGCYAVWLL